MKILIVDDELVSRKTLQKLMTSIGECQAVENGEDALRAVETKPLPDLILLDIMMPGVDGLEVCRRVKAAPETKDIPVIFLSANTRVEDITRGFELGAVDYVTKPFHREEVKARVRTHLTLKKMREDLERQVQEIQEKTEQLRQKDLQLIEMDRIAGIGTLAAGIAHEINNPLGFVKSSVGSVKKGMEKITSLLGYWDDKPLPEPDRKAYQAHLHQINMEGLKMSLTAKFERIERGIERIIKIVNSLRSFARIDMEIVGEADTHRCIEEAINILRPEENGDIEIIRDFQPLPVMKCSVNEINQCLLHVLKNAIDAVEGMGTITLTTSYSMARGQISIQVIDNGKGMSPEVLRQAFHPFFTTKEVGSGTGVGLSLTERIIKRHGGTIQIASKEGEGTTVTLNLPVTECIGKGAHQGPVA